MSTSRQKVCPITEAWSSTARGLGGSASILAAIAASTVVGNSSGPASSVTEAASSSRNSGFPSPAATTRSIAVGGHLREQGRRHGHGLARRERLEREGGLADHAAPPRATGLEELESREREEHHPRVSHVRDEVVDQIQERRVGPVHVLEDDEDRVSLGEVLDEHPRGELEVDDLVGRFVEPEAEDHAEVPRGFLRFGFGVEGGDGGRKLGAGDVDAVVLVDVGDLSDDLACGAVRRAFFVRQAPAPQRDAAGHLDVPRQLASEARLADPCRAEDRHEVRPRRIDRPAPDAGEDLELVVATDERSARHRARTGGVERCEHLPRGDRLTLALGLDRLQLLELERVTDQLVRLSPDQHAAGGRCVLQACRGVGNVTGRERLTRRRVDRDDGLPGTHRSPELEIEPGMRDVQFVDALDDRERRSNGPIGVIGLRERRPEHRHDRITDVLLDGPAIVLDPLPRVVEVELVAIADVLGVGAVGARRRTDDIDEQHGDELPFLLVLGLLGAAGRAEPGAVGEVGTTRHAGHERIVGRRAALGAPADAYSLYRYCSCAAVSPSKMSPNRPTASER